jgi:N-acyl-D-aspartate/D-glutamate deacylase
MRRPEIREQILSEESQYFDTPFHQAVAHGFDRFYPLGDPPDYEPAPEDSVGAQAARAGQDPYRYCYDELLKRDGTSMLFMAAADYSDRSLDTIYERLQNESCVVSLSDAGAHAQSICDASVTTYLLTHWARDRQRGPTLPVEHVVKLQTRDTARLYGLMDRGVLAPGYRADLNLIDFENLKLFQPHMVEDYPTGAGRLLQPVEGYRMTVQAGEVTFEDGEHTGAFPGRLIRGPQPAPA